MIVGVKRLQFKRSNGISIKSVLKSLDINSESVIPGVYTGSRWTGNGKQLISAVDPSTNQVIAQVSTATLGEYHETVENMEKAYRMWRLVSLYI